MNCIEQARLNPLFEGMQRALQDKLKATKDAYSRAVQRAANYFDRCPDDLTVEELRVHPTPKNSPPSLLRRPRAERPLTPSGHGTGLPASRSRTGCSLLPDQRDPGSHEQPIAPRGETASPLRISLGDR